MYADGTAVTAEDIETICDDLKDELTNISKWMRSNKLSPHAFKSDFLIVGHKMHLNSIQKPVQFTIDKNSV